MCKPPLPEAFRRQMEALLGDEAAAYFSAMEQAPCRGLRLNPAKPTDTPLASWISGIGEPVPWEANGRYLSLDSAAGTHPLHEAGAYYLQEPSAMLPAGMLGAQPGETVLDLCAAPGGKSTQLAAAMHGQGLLVCNEPVPSRGQILSRNLERMGVTNALVVSADPSQLAEAWPELFDRVLVDAPCSGEGMFRRHPETRLEWNESSPEVCAARQRRILESALMMLKPDGRLAYSTCTLNRAENEENMLALLRDHPELEALSYPPYSSESGFVRLYPQRVHGEGHFAALLHKTASTAPHACALQPAAALGKPDKQLHAAYATFVDELAIGHMPDGNACLGDTLLSAPDLPPLRGIRVLRAGLALGQLKGKVFAPDHALAMSSPPLPHLALDEAQARQYQRGETLSVAESCRGYCLPTFAGLPLGFGKASNGQLKNHYPKGLRRP